MNMRLSSAGVLVCIAALVPALALAQSFGRGTSRYQSQINALGSTPVVTLPIPVLFGVELSDLTKNFGDARGGGTRTHEGLDILARDGTPIASPTDAVVVRVGNGSSSGLYVRTANPGGEQFVYMHLSKVAEGIEPGDSLKRGDILGFVGNTGNASGGPAHLHFEIRKDGAQDPYPRLTTVFSESEISQSIADAQQKGITISSSVLAGRSSGSSAPPVPSVPSRKATLVFGETNADIITLQKFLIASAEGGAGARLANTGATGYFGSLTREALIEYQKSAGLTPSGVVDDATYTQIFALQGEGDSSETAEEGGAGTDTGFIRDLDVGMTGEDVRALQVFLNTHGFVIAQSGVGSPDNETNYFGSLTRAALAKYQAANDIAPAVGYFGPKTRAHVLAH